jgi:hypothetical protein
MRTTTTTTQANGGLHGEPPIGPARQGQARFEALVDELRAEADLAGDATTRALYEAAAEVVDGLARAFRQVAERQAPNGQGVDVPQPA